MRSIIPTGGCLCAALVFIALDHAPAQPYAPGPSPSSPRHLEPVVVAPLGLPVTPEPPPLRPAPRLITPRIVPRPPINVPAFTPPPLDFDEELKELTLNPGETNAMFTFHLTNSSPADVVITSVRTSCGCTVAKLPPVPWTLAPGESGEISVAMDMRGKRGTLTKSVTVSTTSGFKSLLVRAHAADQNALQTTGLDMDRLRNIQLAMTDRQVVFKNDCADCHVKPAIGKTGQPLYEAACAICHEGPHRASMVPDLKAKALTVPTGYDYWKHWITFGKAGSLMPAFAQIHGGPLTDEQIHSLAEYLTEAIPSRTTAAPVNRLRLPPNVLPSPKPDVPTANSAPANFPPERPPSYNRPPPSLPSPPPPPPALPERSGGNER
jgi:cytochrome c5